uniref:Uncharacterized protein n=1 Tax=Parastrongyloides trichosuri TaxID=131310 RepID=A0A0N5A4P7_PARTI
MEKSKIVILTSVTIGSIVGVVCWLMYINKKKDTCNEDNEIISDTLKKNDEIESEEKSSINNECDVKSINSYEEIHSNCSSEASFPSTPTNSPSNKDLNKKSKIPIYVNTQGECNDTPSSNKASPTSPSAKGLSKLVEPKVLRRRQS